MATTGKTAKPFILLITGISTAGKSTAIDALKKDKELSHVKIIDVDETGIPKAGRGPWRVYRAEELLYNARHHAEKGFPTIVGGIIPPHEWIESKEYRLGLNIHFLLLKTDTETLKKRLRARLKRQQNLQDFTEIYTANSKLASNLESQVANQKNGHIIETQGLTKKAVCDEICKLIERL